MSESFGGIWNGRFGDIIVAETMDEGQQFPASCADELDAVRFRVGVLALEGGGDEVDFPLEFGFASSADTGSSWGAYFGAWIGEDLRTLVSVSEFSVSEGSLTVSEPEFMPQLDSTCIPDAGFVAPSSLEVEWDFGEPTRTRVRAVSPPSGAGVSGW